MITKTENAATVAVHADFTRLVTEYKALLTAQGLPLSIDVELLKTTLKTQLFQKLLGADKGLKMRFDMLKSQDARLRLVSETVDLAGYDIVDTLAQAVKGLETAYKKIYTQGLGFMWQVVTFAQFADAYELDLAALLDSFTYDWTGKEHVLAYVQGLGAKVEQLRDILRATVGSHYTFADTCHVLGRFFTPGSAEGVVIADEGSVMRLVTDLDKLGKLGMIPKK
jgi:hypothetical protein